MTVYLGVTNVQLPAKEGLNLQAERIIPHPLYDSNNVENTFPYDIALVSLPEAINITSYSFISQVF